MGTLIVKIPENIDAEFEISDSEIVKEILNMLNLNIKCSKLDTESEQRMSEEGSDETPEP